MNPTIRMHYGEIVVSENPVTGVFNANNCTNLWDEPEVDPDYGWYCIACGMEFDSQLPSSCSACGHVIEEMNYHDFSSDTTFYGAWLEVEQEVGRPKWEPDLNGEYAAIYDSNTNYVQVVHSQRIAYGRLASPCYPGQVDARLTDPDKPDDVHVQAYFALPLDITIPF